MANFDYETKNTTTQTDRDRLMRGRNHLVNTAGWLYANRQYKSLKVEAEHGFVLCTTPEHYMLKLLELWDNSADQLSKNAIDFFDTVACIEYKNLVRDIEQASKPR